MRFHRNIQWQYDATLPPHQAAKGNPVKSGTVEMTEAAIRNMIASRNTPRRHAKAMSIEAMNAIFDWSLSQCPSNPEATFGALHRIGNRILLQYSASRYCKKSLNSLTMSLARIPCLIFKVFLTVSLSTYMVKNILNIIMMLLQYSVGSIYFSTKVFRVRLMCPAMGTQRRIL
jgi:hypothetical protein